MKPFKFRLQSLLQIRERRITSLQGELFDAQNIFTKLKEEYQKIQLEILEVDEQMRQGSDRENAETYLTHLYKSLFALQDTLITQEKAVRGLQNALFTSLRERKIVEKLKERRYAQWQSEELKEERAFLDELALKKFS